MLKVPHKLFYFRPHPNLAVVFGEHDISNNHSDAVSEVDQIIRLKKSAVVIKVKQIIIHPEFNNRTIDNDLALLRLEAPVRFDTHIGKMNVIFIKSFELFSSCRFQCQFVCH